MPPDSVIYYGFFSIFGKLGNHHHNLTLERFIPQ
jgi:hypothetical protein